MNLTTLRKNYKKAAFSEQDALPNPFDQFQNWFEDAMHAQLLEPNACQLATVNERQEPEIRTVLLKGVNDGFEFFTNYHSQKGRDIDYNPKVSLLFLWLDIERQVRISGTALKLSDEENDQYFNSRPLESRLGAIASRQSEVLNNREELVARFLELKKLPESQIVRPKYWGGYSVIPHKFEFWQGREGRLHDRIAYLKNENGSWFKQRLNP